MTKPTRDYTDPALIARLKAVAARMAEDPDVIADVEHTQWHMDNLVDFDGSCPQRCTAVSADEFLARVLR